MNNKDADQTAWMRRLICVFVVRIWQNRFSHDVAQIIMIIFLISVSSTFSFVLGLVPKKTNMHTKTVLQLIPIHLQETVSLFKIMV